MDEDVCGCLSCNLVKVGLILSWIVLPIVTLLDMYDQSKVAGAVFIFAILGYVTYFVLFFIDTNGKCKGCI